MNMRTTPSPASEGEILVAAEGVQGFGDEENIEISRYVIKQLR